MVRIAYTILAVLITVIATAGAARAQFGALAYDENTRAYGHAEGLPSPLAAEQTALGYCRSPGCHIVVRTGPGQCSAIAASAYSGTWYHWSTGGSRGEAEARAIGGCQGDAGQPCRPIAWQCNGG